MSTLIKVQEVTKWFGETEVLAGICFEVKERETLCILGG